jgi:hypothetical protein
MKIRSIWCVVSMFVLAGAAGCSSPCRDLCATMVDRFEACGLGESAGEEAIDDCGDEISETYSDEACSDATTEVEAMSCGDLAALMEE